MEKIVKSGFRDCTATLDGSECSVKFDSCYRAFSVRNDGMADVYISKYAGIVPDADGVMCVKAGGSAVFAHMDIYADTVYLLGTGKLQIHAQNDTNNPFKSAPVATGGGGETAGYISDGLILYSDLNDVLVYNAAFDAELGRSVNNCDGTNGYGVFTKSDVVSQLSSEFTLQILIKTTTVAGCIFGVVYDSPFKTAMLIVENGGCIGMERASGNFVSDKFVSDDKWHMLTAAYDGTTMRLYADGVKCFEYVQSWNIPSNAVICIGQWQSGGAKYIGNIANACIYNRCLSESEILQNWQTDVSRYGIGGD